MFRLRKRLFSHSTSLILLLGFISSASSAPIQSSTTGLSSPAATIDFSEVSLSANTSVTTQFQSLGITFDSGDVFYDPSLVSSSFPGNLVGNRIGNFTNSTSVFTVPFSILFVNQQPEAAFSFHSLTSGTTTFRALLGSTEVESFTATTSGTGFDDFFGFTGITFDEIEIVGPSSGTAALALVDNIQLGSTGSGASIPEPSSLALLGIAGASMLGFQRRRFRRKSGREPDHEFRSS